MSELLKDRALIWFRNNHKSWEQWAQFKDDLLGFFLPQRYMEKLEAEIRSRTQRPRENFKDYVLALQDLMYHSNMSKEEKLEIIFRNSAPDYQWYVRRRDFETLDDLLSLAAELESIPTSRHPAHNEHHRMLRKRPVESNVQDKAMTALTWEEEKIKATVLLNQQLHTARIDTGATRSFVSPSCIKRMRPRPSYISTATTVTLADGSKKQISSAVDVQVTIGNLSRHHKFLVVKEATEAVVLGIDFLRAFNSTIQCAGLNAKYQSIDRVENRKKGFHQTVRGPTNINFSHSSTPITLTEDKATNLHINEFLKEELPKSQQIEGVCNVATHRIIMKDERPIKIRHAPRNPGMQAIVDKEINSRLKRGCTEPARSPYSFPITHVKKKNGSRKTCKYFRQLNARSVPDAYALPRIDSIFDRLRSEPFTSKNSSPSSRALSYLPKPIPPPPPWPLEYSSIPPPPPLQSEYSPTPSPLMVSLEQTTFPRATSAVPNKAVTDDPLFEQLSVEVQKRIREKQEANKGKRYRTIQEIEDCLYRITTKANGVTHITLVEMKKKLTERGSSVTPKVGSLVFGHT